MWLGGMIQKEAECLVSLTRLHFEGSFASRLWLNALMPRGNFLLSSHKRKQKEPRGVPSDPRTALRQQYAESHDPTRSASLPKRAVLVQQAHTHRRFKHMERLVFCCYATRFCGRCLGLPPALSGAEKCCLRKRSETLLFVLCALFKR